MAKEKIRLAPGMQPEELLEKIATKYAHLPQNREDGVKLELPEGWIHLRKSNTEPIIRIYTEATSPEKARALATEIIKDLKQMM